MSARLVRGLSELDYHADTTTLSASSAKILLGKRPPSGDSDALSLGRLVHLLLLEPARVDEYAVLDPNIIGVKANGERADNPTATKAWKDAVFAAKTSGLTVVSPQFWGKAGRMAAAVMAHPEASRLLAGATETELSAYATHPSGAEVRARFDAVWPGESLIDIKTTRNADPAEFGRTVHAFGYHVSAANYLDIANANGLGVKRFDLICVENEPNLAGDYRVSVLELHPDAIDRGRDLMAQACDRWLALGKRVELPDYGTDRHQIDLPPWAYDYDDDLDLKIGGVA